MDYRPRVKISDVGLAAITAVLLLAASYPDEDTEVGELPTDPSKLEIETVLTDDGSDQFDSNDPDTGEEQSEPKLDYQWLPACGENFPGETAVTCPGMYTCESADETKWYLWVRELPGGEWRPLATDCYGDEPPDSAPDLRPQVTDVDVLREVRRVGLPDAEVSVQPEGVTLVQLDTIFYTHRPAFEHSVTLLGYEVDIRAEPVEFRWHHGDGTEQTTTTPGAPYPAMDVIHRYTDADVTVRPSVDVTYQVQWRVDGAAWHSLAETLTASGPPTSVRIKEATAVLKDPYS